MVVLALIQGEIVTRKVSRHLIISVVVENLPDPVPEFLHDPGGAPVLHEVRVAEVSLAMVEVPRTSLPPLSLYPHLAPQSCNETEVKIKTGGGLYNQE